MVFVSTEDGSLNARIVEVLIFVSTDDGSINARVAVGLICVSTDDGSHIAPTVMVHLYVMLMLNHVTLAAELEDTAD